MSDYLVILALLIAMPAMAVSDETNLDGVYTESTTMINEQGQQKQFFPYGHAVLELRGDQFKYWHFSDAASFTKFPISGKFTRDGERIELLSDKLAGFGNRYVATTIKGVFGIWPEKELADWKAGKYPTFVPILLRVADGPVGEKLDESTFVFPTVTPLLDLVAAKRYWAAQQKKYEARYMDVPNPLRKLLRAQSRRGDGDMSGYKALIAEHQKQLTPELVEQFMTETGKGVSVVVGPMVLNDLYGWGSTITGEPAFAKTNATKKAALKALVDAMPKAIDSRGLNAALFVFLRTSGLQEIDIICSGGNQVMLRIDENGMTRKTYRFNETVANECSDWANERLVELFGAAE